MRRAILIGVLAAALGIAAGCGGEQTVQPLPETVVGSVAEPATPAPEEPAGDPAAGKQVFADGGCAGCHILADAGAAGAVGPNLDETKPDLATVIDRVTNGKGTMPALGGTLSDQQIADVAAYVVQATSG